MQPQQARSSSPSQNKVGLALLPRVRAHRGQYFTQRVSWRCNVRPAIAALSRLLRMHAICRQLYNEQLKN